jgi:predicted amidohydrolase
MDHLRLDLRTFDIGATADSPAAYASLLTDRVLESWENGADIVVFPEFSWMGLERFVERPDKLAGVADLFWNDLYPLLLTTLTRADKAAVLGTVPFRDPDSGLKNRAPIVSEGRWLHQDKIHLTPWESDFTGGGPLHLWTFRGHRVAVVICLDVEVPEIAAALRGSALDLMLVPSATENLLGLERVGRCADARAVELGCHVGLCHLVGTTDSTLVDENIGQLAHFSPSQSPFLHHPRQERSPLFTDGFHLKSVTLDMAALAASRELQGETNPSKLRALPVRIVTG